VSASLIIGIVLATWALLSLVGNERTRQLHDVNERARARAAAEAAAQESVEEAA
jgi:hypothetical protein